MKYKVIGITNIIAGSVYFLLDLVTFILFFPQFLRSYETSNVQMSSISLQIFEAIISLLVFISAVLVGVKLVKKPGKNLFIIGIIQTTAMFLFAAYFIWLLTLSRSGYTSMHPPKASSPFRICDLDHNKVCDEADDSMFKSTFGKCRGESGYNFEADFDGDGCVVSVDERAYHESKL